MYPKRVRKMAKEMADELENNRLEVTLAETEPEKTKHPGHKLRVVVSTNPDWYRKLCARYVSTRKRGWRKNRTAIKREATLRALRRIEAGKEPRRGKQLIREPRYIAMLLPVVRNELKHIKERRAQERKPIELVEVSQRPAREDWEPF